MSEERYRVRDKDWVAVWGENLTLAQAQKLKEKVVGERKSRTARVEPMSVPPPAEFLAELAQLGGPSPETRVVDDSSAARGADTRDPVATVEPQPIGVVYEIADPQAVTVPSRGLVAKIPPGHELHVNGARAMSFPVVVDAGDVVQAVVADPYLANARARAVATVAPVVARAPKVPYRDKTVGKPRQRTGPAPKDKTVPHAPRLVRLGAPPVAPPRPPRSPLAAAVELDGDLLPDDALSDADVVDLTADLGGGPSPEDVARAEAERDKKTSPGV